MDTPRGNSWIDAQTKAVLQQVPPQKAAPASTDTFSVVVLSCEAMVEHARHVRAFHRVLGTSLIDAEFQTTRRPPFILKREFTASGAMLAQFELVCCDIVSVFISDAVMSDADPSYLAELYGSLARADEFEEVGVRVVSIPPHGAGRAFLEQFVGDGTPCLPYDMVATRKKARLMTHWATKVGAKVAMLPV